MRWNRQKISLPAPFTLHFILHLIHKYAPALQLAPFLFVHFSCLEKTIGVRIPTWLIPAAWAIHIQWACRKSRGHPFLLHYQGHWQIVFNSSMGTYSFKPHPSTQKSRAELIKTLASKIQKKKKIFLILLRVESGEDFFFEMRWQLISACFCAASTMECVCPAWLTLLEGSPYQCPADYKRKTRDSSWQENSYMCILLLRHSAQGSSKISEVWRAEFYVKLNKHTPSFLENKNWQGSGKDIKAIFL